MCTEVLEHIPDPVAALKEFSRLLKPRGYLLITAPFVSLTHFAPYHFASGLSRFFYEHHLHNLGFTITELQLNGSYFEFLGQEIRRIKQTARNYSRTELSFLDRVIIHLQLYVLQKLSKKDKGSSELLCYGIHVFSEKSEIDTDA
jgi:ubiquinone/menaquinone biosynthesis C-methylase UbiE